MSNSNIIARLHCLLDEYEAEEIQPTQLEKAVQSHMEAIEGLSYEQMKRADLLCYRIVTADLRDGDEVSIAPDAVEEVLSDFRKFIDQLPLSQ